MAGSIKPKQILDTLDAMLRVVTPDQPFQPLLAASIDPHAWRAVFVDHCKTLKKACKQAGASDATNEACDELHEFAATIYGDSYFDHFHATKYRDRDPQEFGPDDEFFASNLHWLHAERTAKPAITAIRERLRMLEEEWAEACGTLSRCLTEGKTAAVFPAALALAGTKTKKKTVLDWLSPARPGPGQERRAREKRVHAEVFVTETLLRHIKAAIKQAFPEKGGKGVRQEASKKIGDAAARVLASYHLQSGWETLRTHAAAVVALVGLLAEVRKSLTKSSKRSQPTDLNGLPLLESLRRISPEVLDPDLRKRWDTHLKNPAQKQAVISSMNMLAEGYAAIGQDTLGKRLRAASKEDTATGWTDKAEERLRELGSDMLAVHGSENWILPPTSAKKGGEFRKPRKGYGWLVNPLLVLWEPVYKGL